MVIKIVLIPFMVKMILNLNKDRKNRTMINKNKMSDKAEIANLKQDISMKEE